MDIFLLISNAIIWAVVGCYKLLTGFFVSILGMVSPKLAIGLSLTNVNEGLHTVALILAIIASSITILLAVRNHIKQKK